MIDLEAGGNAKLGRLSDAEFRCHITGILPLAAKAPVRGRLLVGDHHATAHDVARQARMSLPIARRTLTKLRDLGVIELDEELGCEMVHDFGEWNPPPKSDRTNAARQARYRERLALRYGTSRNAVTESVTNGVTNGEITLPEVEGEEKTPVTPPAGGETDGRVVRFERKPVPRVRLELAERLLAEFNQKAGTDYSAYTGNGHASEDLRRIIGALTRRPDVDFDQAAASIHWQLHTASPYWQGAPHTGVVFGPKVFDSCLASAQAAKNEPSTDDFLAGINSRRAG